MSGDVFEQIEEALARGPEAGFEFLAGKFLAEKNYRALFETRIMQKRYELHLPLIQGGGWDDVPEEKRKPYERGFLEAAREVGGLFLADGDIASAWPYFRAIGDTAPVKAAIEKVEPGEGVEPVIEIAFVEGVHPYKGFELILGHYGTCRAISAYEQYPARAGREECARLLVRTLHRELVERLKYAIEQAEGWAPDTERVTELIAGRDWLFGEYSYYIDTSHLMSVIRYAAELDDPQTLELAVELTEYGKRLSHHFQYKGDPPFENICEDYGILLHALLGRNVDTAVAHFRKKVAGSDPEQTGPFPAQVLVQLLTRVKRYPEAIDAAAMYLQDGSALQLCQSVGDFRRLKLLARERGDLLAFAAGAIQA